MTYYEQWPWHELCSVLCRYTDEVITPAARLREDLHIDDASLGDAFGDLHALFALDDECDDALDDAQTVGDLLRIIRVAQ